MPKVEYKENGYMTLLDQQSSSIDIGQRAVEKVEDGKFVLIGNIFVFIATLFSICEVFFNVNIVMWFSTSMLYISTT